MSCWLNIVGVTEQGIEALDPKARALLASAQVIIGPDRFLQKKQSITVGAEVTLIKWQPPLSTMIEQIMQQRGEPTIILATGDPNWFGIGATLKKHVSDEEFQLHPSPSAFQLAAAKMHWPIQNTSCISLHGRAVETLHPHVLPANRVLALTSNADTVKHVAQILLSRGYKNSHLTVLENLGSANERRLSFPASEAMDQKMGDFYTLAIDCVANDDAPLLSTVPGLPDDAFISDGQLTKREVRSATLAKLAPFPGALLWDVGAGCGAVAIEWMRAARDTKAICFERDDKRQQMIAHNRNALGTPTLEIVSGNAPQNLVQQPTPDAIFIGGDVANNELFSACWHALKPGGRLVANAVTMEGERALFDRHESHGGALARIEVSVTSNVGNYRVLKPRMAVTQWLVTKADEK